jgi:hypothetical protein
MVRWWMVLALLVLGAAACSSGTMERTSGQDRSRGVERDAAPGPVVEEPESGSAADVDGPLERDGRMRLLTESDGFADTYARVIEAAERVGARVIEASSASRGASRASGTLSLLVPDDSYTALVNALSDLGRVDALDITATRRASAELPDGDGVDDASASDAWSRLFIEVVEPAAPQTTMRASWQAGRDTAYATFDLLLPIVAVVLAVALPLGALALVVLAIVRLWRGVAARRQPPSEAADAASPPVTTDASGGR